MASCRAIAKAPPSWSAALAVAGSASKPLAARMVAMAALLSLRSCSSSSEGSTPSCCSAPLTSAVLSRGQMRVMLSSALQALQRH
jgi:hypothetical protein